MGCGCKQNNQSKPKNEVTPVPIPPSPIEPNYTLEELDKLDSYLNINTRDEHQKQFVYDFIYRIYQQVTPDYCNTICLNSMRNRSQDLRQKYLMYQEYLKTKTD
jgi:hypothetical protein